MLRRRFLLNGEDNTPDLIITYCAPLHIPFSSNYKGILRGYDDVDNFGNENNTVFKCVLDKWKDGIGEYGIKILNWVDGTWYNSWSYKKFVDFMNVNHGSLGNYMDIVNGEQKDIMNFHNTITDVIFPNEIKHLEGVAVSGSLDAYNNSVVNVTLPENLETLSDNVLYSLHALKTITIPSSVIYMGNNTLQIDCADDDITSIIPGNYSLEEIIMKPTVPPNTDTSAIPIGSYNPDRYINPNLKIRVYADCLDTYKNDTVWGQYSDLYDTINNSIIYYSDIGGGSFFDANASINSIFLNGRGVLESPYNFVHVDVNGGFTGNPHTIIFPSSVKSIKRFPFTESVQNILFSSLIDSIQPNILHHTTWYQNQSDGFVILNNILYDYKPDDMALTGALIIPEGVVSITDNLFTLSGINSVTFPSTLKRIESYAFMHCNKLLTINIPASVEYIGNGAFTDNWAYNITVNDNNLFYADYDSNCIVEIATKKLITASNPNNIPSNVEIIGPYACTALSSKNLLIDTLVMPDSVRILEDYAYSYYNDCTSLTLSLNLEIIGQGAFILLTKLPSITIPPKVTSIGGSAFYGCSSLTEIVIPNSVTNIQSTTFSQCSSLASITIPESVTNIEYRAFDGCSSLTSVTIPNSVTSIGNSVFCNCSSLTSVTIPNGVTSMGWDDFEGCSKLTSVVWNAKNCADFSLSYLAPFDGIRSQITSFTFGDSVEHIPVYLCFGMLNLQSINIPNSVEIIGESAFLYCHSLTSVTIGNGVKNIGGFVFSQCESLTSITFNGTKAQWKGIELGRYWNNRVPATVVHCTDGDVEL